MKIVTKSFWGITTDLKISANKVDYFTNGDNLFVPDEWLNNEVYVAFKSYKLSFEKPIIVNHTNQQIKVRDARHFAAMLGIFLNALLFTLLNEFTNLSSQVNLTMVHFLVMMSIIVLFYYQKQLAKKFIIVYAE